MTRSLDPETLLAHSAWVRRLARSLVADDSTAEDVLQDTMVAALEHPPRTGAPGDSLRAWLSTVTRHLALRRRREDSRRDERQRSVARRNEIPSVDRVLELESSRRRLVEHVLALEETYRDAILLRYFDDLPTHEIAKRFGVKDSTVRNRLRRGLALLHERLEREHGESWRSWCLLLAGTGSGGSKLSLLLLSAAAALTTIFSWQVLHPADAPSAEHPAIAARQAPSESPPLGGPVGVGAARTEAALGSRTPSVDPASAVDAVGLLCFGAVRTKANEAIVSGTVSIEDRLGRSRECRLDARSWYSFAGLAPGVWTLRTRSAGYRPFESTVELSQDQPVERHDLVLEAAVLLNVRIRVTSAEKAAMPRHQPLLTVVATKETPPDRLVETAGSSHVGYGIGEYRFRQTFGRRDDRIPPGYDGVLELDGSLPCCVSLVLRHIVLESKQVPAGATEVEFLVEPDAGTRLLAEARVRVVDAKSGAPLHPAHVELNPCDIGGGGVQTDEDGVAVFKDLLPGPLELTVGGEQHAWFQPGVQIEPAKMNDLGTLRVPSSCRLAGRVVDEDGAPVSIGVTWLNADSTDRPDRFRIYESTRSDSEGRFEFESVPRGNLLLWSLPDGDDEPIACAAVDTSSGDRDDAVLRLERGRVIGLRFEAAEFERAAWILRRSDGVAIRARNWMDRSPVPLRLPDGAYRVEVWRNGAAVGAQEFRVPGDSELIHVRL